MVSPLPTLQRDVEIIYPDSDGQPIAENTLQFDWITTIKGGLEALFRDRDDVFVAGDLLWYPVEGDPFTCHAPDTMVAFGRPKGRRGSYLQWREGGIAPQVVFEVLSPGNTGFEMQAKHAWYERYGVEEYYVYDPDHGRLEGWLRAGGLFHPIASMPGWASPRLGVTFGLEGTDLVLTRPDGRRLQSYLDVDAERAEATARAEQEHLRAEQQHLRAEEEHLRAERLAARLRELGLTDDEL